MYISVKKNSNKTVIAKKPLTNLYEMNSRRDTIAMFPADNDTCHTDILMSPVRAVVLDGAISFSGNIHIKVLHRHLAEEIRSRSHLNRLENQVNHTTYV